MSVSSGSMSIGVLAILTGLVGSYAFRALLMNDPPPPEPKQQSQVVPLATADLPAGREVHLGDVGLMRMTQQQMIERKLPGGYMNDPQQIIGRVLKDPIKQGQPFVPGKLYLQGLNENPSARLRPGYRLYSMVVPPSVASGLSSETWVDIIFKFNARAAMGRYPAIPETTKPLLLGVEVLSVKMPRAEVVKNKRTLDIRRVDGAVAPDEAVVTLAVTPDELMKLETAQGKGVFYIAVRPGAEPTYGVQNSKNQNMTIEDLLEVKPLPPPQPPKQPWTIDTYKRGGMSQRSFDRDRMIYELQRDNPTSPDAAADPSLQPQAALPPLQPQVQPLNPGASIQKPVDLGGGNNPVDKLNNMRATTDPFSEAAKIPQ